MTENIMGFKVLLLLRSYADKDNIGEKLVFIQYKKCSGLIDEMD